MNNYFRKIKTSMLVVAMLLGVSVYAQQPVITGTVKDANKEALIGVSVIIKGTQQGTITDIDGKYSVNVPDGNAVLQFLYMGYITQEVTVGEQRIINITLLESATAIDELIVVGYGTQRVKDLTGSAVAVNMDELIQTPGASIIDALAGQVVGLHVSTANGRPGSTGSLRIREPLTSGSGGTSPLIVIDDVVQDGTGALNRLDYSEIENFTVLKDASAAIYGSRASAGVIVIKTKRGTIGKTKIDYSGKLDFSDAVSHIKVMDAYETGLFSNRMMMQNKINNNGTDVTSYMYSGAELMAMKSLNHNWLDEAWSSAVSQRHSLSVSGGQENVSFFAGLNFQDQGNNLGSIQDYDRWTFRAGGEVKVTTGMKLSASVSGYNSRQVSVYRQASMPAAGPWGSAASSNDYSQLRHMPKYIPMSIELMDPVKNEMSSFWVSPWTGPMDTSVPNETNVGNGYQAWNFFANEASKARSFSDGNGYNANFSLTYDVPYIKGLTLRGVYSVSYDNSGSNSLGDYYTVARANNISESGKHLIGDYTNWYFIEYGNAESAKIEDKPDVSYGKSVRKSEQMSFWTTYNRTFGEHNISLTGVLERGESESSSTSLHYLGLTRSYLGTSSTAGELTSSGTSFGKSEAASFSYVGRFNYRYADRYLFEFIFRSDASTKFAPENYWGFFPGASAGWVLSEEKFFKNSKVAEYIDFLKLRYSLGKTGKDNADAWRWLATYGVSATSGIGFGEIGGEPTVGASPSTAANRDIKWDESVKQNMAIDLSIFNNRLTFTTEHWTDHTTGLIMERADPEEPIYIGQRMLEVNYGKKNAWGWEFSLRWSDRIQQSLLPSWGPIKYGVAIDYGISWTENVLGKPYVFDYPSDVSEASDRTGWKSPGYEWGFRTWKNTSTGDGMLRTQADIDKYWQYLTDLAAANGTSPNYLGIANKSDMKPGMLAYEDVAGDLNQENQTVKGPNGIISRDHGQDYVQLASKLRHSIPMKLSLQWGNFSWQANLQSSWGGIALIDQDVRQGIGSSTMMWAQFAFVNDMFDPIENPNGKYPSMAVASAFGEVSDFWMVSTFRCYVRNMTMGYSLPKDLLKKTKLGIDRLQFNLTGNNLWDFYNPYPYKYRNMYDGGRTGYPTLRTWTFSINASF